MSSIVTVRGLKGRSIAAIAVMVRLPAVIGGLAMEAQNRDSLKIPNGLAFSDFKGYENWRPVAVSQTEHGIKVIVANDLMIDAYRSGVPGNGKLFPPAPRSRRSNGRSSEIPSPLIS
jgi:hypothetical protein